MAAGDKVYIADKATLDAVNNKTGATGDSGGTTTAGTLFGKLNAIISSITAQAQKVLQAITKIDEVNTNVINGTKRLSAKKVVASVPGGATVTVLNVSGSGVFHGGYIGQNSENCTCVVTLDGVDYTVDNGNVGTFGRILSSPDMFSVITSANPVVPAEFNESLRVSVQAKSGLDVPFYGDYSVRG